MSPLETPLHPGDQYCIVSKAPSSETTHRFPSPHKTMQASPQRHFGDSQKPKRNFKEGPQDIPRRIPRSTPRRLQQVPRRFFGDSKKLPGRVRFQVVTESSQDVPGGLPYAPRASMGNLRNSQEDTACTQEAPGGSWRFLGNL